MTGSLRLILIALCFSLACCTSRKRELEKTTVLEVADQRLSAKAFAEKLAAQLRQYDALTVKDSSTLLRIKEEILKNFIVDVATAKYAKENNLLVNDADLDKEINLIRGNYPDDHAFRKALAEENLPFEEWRQGLRSSLMQRRVVRRLMEDLPEPSDAEAKKYYDENLKEFDTPEKVRLTQVVVVGEEDAQLIYDKAKKGGSIAELAKKYSIAPDGKDGGDTGWLAKGTLAVFDRAFTMGIGSLSPILKSSYGFHIYRVTAKQAAHRLSFEQVKASIKNRLQADREQSIYGSWLEGQLQKIKVRRNEAVINSITVETRN